MRVQVERLAADALAVPAYLSRTYWWAYVHPNAVRVFERQWLVNLILWGNFGKLRDAAIAALGDKLGGRTLQIACVYGDLTERLLKRLPVDGALDVVDVLRVQLENAARKLPGDPRVGLIQGDSSALEFEPGTYDRALLFFLLHEQPEDVRRKTLSEALRILKPGGRLVIVDYHRPALSNPLYLPMAAILKTLEPFALDLWRNEIEFWLPREAVLTTKVLWFRGLYQLLVVTKGGWKSSRPTS
jgi:ubiquinone/menaquinone biosynthesis C-methylase UbiE